MHMCTLMCSQRKAPSFSFKKKDKSIETYISGLYESVGKLYLSVRQLPSTSETWLQMGGKWIKIGLLLSVQLGSLTHRGEGPRPSLEASDSVAPLAPYPGAWERLQIIGGQGKATEYSVLAPPHPH